eukprot:gene14110-21620_t
MGVPSRDDTCAECCSQFSFFKRRHACAACKFTFCEACSVSRAGVRRCRACHRDRETAVESPLYKLLGPLAEAHYANFVTSGVEMASLASMRTPELHEFLANACVPKEHHAFILARISKFRGNPESTEEQSLSLGGDLYQPAAARSTSFSSDDGSVEHDDLAFTMPAAIVHRNGAGSDRPVQKQRSRLKSGGGSLSSAHAGDLFPRRTPRILRSTSPDPKPQSNLLNSSKDLALKPTQSAASPPFGSLGSSAKDEHPYLTVKRKRLMEEVTLLEARAIALRENARESGPKGLPLLESGYELSKKVEKLTLALETTRVMVAGTLAAAAKKRFVGHRYATWLSWMCWKRKATRATGEWHREENEVKRRKALFLRGLHHSKGCAVCRVSFSTFQREHHCRACYRAVCAGCCPQTKPRICVPCLNINGTVSSQGLTASSPD